MLLFIWVTFSGAIADATLLYFVGFYVSIWGRMLYEKKAGACAVSAGIDLKIRDKSLTREEGHVTHVERSLPYTQGTDVRLFALLPPVYRRGQ